MILVIYLLPGDVFFAVAVVALPLLLPQPKPPPEADKSPGSPKLATGWHDDKKLGKKRKGLTFLRGFKGRRKEKRATATKNH